jgi:hypothetical protein
MAKDLQFGTIFKMVVLMGQLEGCRKLDSRCRWSMPVRPVSGELAHSELVEACWCMICRGDVLC